MNQITGNNSKQKSINSNSFLIGLFVNYLKPSTYVTSIKNINLNKLKQQGIKLIICDLDNTLVPHYNKFPTKVSLDFVNSVKENGFKFILVSNNTNKRVSFFAEKLDVDYISNAKKPFPFSMSKAIKNHNLKSQEVVVIGDMIITDILTANFIHAESILVQPVLNSQGNISWFIKWIEQAIYSRLIKQNLLIKEEETGRNLYSDDYEIL
ncbi:MAG: YqeG family HAD IIIA-type phosphatase [Mycoplasmataceae bacterium]|nr:YqeG family HAD IIIA-type phosphatase [Mycoplasmataceae bacterium]